jgi:hypothetical protein
MSKRRLGVLGHIHMGHIYMGHIHMGHMHRWTSECK